VTEVVELQGVVVPASWPAGITSCIAEIKPCSERPLLCDAAIGSSHRCVTHKQPVLHSRCGLAWTDDADAR